MQHQLKKEDLAKLYREFSRQKYNKYRHQFPRMRESQLVSKIIKEWEALKSQEKEQLYDTYLSEKHIAEDRSQSSENEKGKKPSPGSSKDKKIKIQSASGVREKDEPSSNTKDGRKSSSKPTPKKSGVRVFVESSSSKKQKAQSQSSDFARDGVKKDFQISESDSKELGQKVGKRKRISKDGRQPRTQYLKFFKFYYEKLSGEHKRWSASQISTIIKLLWKKKLTTDKAAAKTGLRTPKERRRISGRMAFRRTFNYTGIEGAERWKQLPVESRKYWRIKGEGLRSGQRRVYGPVVNWRRLARRGSQSQSINSNNVRQFSFLKAVMAA